MKILLVDDYRDAVDALRMYLVASGFVVETAFDGSTGLETAVIFRPDVIVLDLQMPGLSGVELAAALKERPETAAVPLIAVSGHGEADEPGELRRLFAAVIVKPCDPGELIATIGRVTTMPAD